MAHPAGGGDPPAGEAGQRRCVPLSLPSRSAWGPGALSCSRCPSCHASYQPAARLRAHMLPGCPPFRFLLLRFLLQLPFPAHPCWAQTQREKEQQQGQRQERRQGRLPAAPPGHAARRMRGRARQRRASGRRGPGSLCGMSTAWPFMQKRKGRTARVARSWCLRSCAPLPKSASRSGAVVLLWTGVPHAPLACRVWLALGGACPIHHPTSGRTLPTPLLRLPPPCLRRR